jgi:linoleoyl-CoA desaturase
MPRVPPHLHARRDGVQLLLHVVDPAARRAFVGRDRLIGGLVLKFAPDKGFHQEVDRRVLAYFESTGRSQKSNAAMVGKTVVLLAWFALSYVLLVFAAQTWWQGVVASLSLAMAMAGVGFSVQHDANHGAYSKSSAVNRAMGLTLDALGASSYLWRFKHNVAHHTFTNLAGADDDINLAPFARIAPTQPHHAFHRVQHIYLWVLYGFLMFKWHLVYDFKNLARGWVAKSRFPRPRGWSLVELLAGKLFFFAWALAIPFVFHPWWAVLVFYGLTSFVLGVLLSVVFQLAHCVEETDFPEVTSDAQRLPIPWAVHQVQATADFAPRNRLLTWYVGGLNFQIEHHLFPRMCHVHYPHVAAIVRSVCDDLGVRYTSHETLGQALASHGRWLRRMGRMPEVEPTLVAAA